MVKKILIFIIFLFIHFNTSADLYIPPCSNCPEPRDPTLEMKIEDIVYYDNWSKFQPEKRINPLFYYVIFNVLAIWTLFIIRLIQIYNKKPKNGK